MLLEIIGAITLLMFVGALLVSYVITMASLSNTDKAGLNFLILIIIIVCYYYANENANNTVSSSW